MSGKIFSINIGAKEGEPKAMLMRGMLKEDYGFEGDVHAGRGDRQVSLLAIEEIEKAEASCRTSGADFHPGIFAENITTVGMDLSKVRPQDRLFIGENAVLKVTQIGKERRSGCGIMQFTGQCIMPRQGVFAVVERGGLVRVYDIIRHERQKSFWPWSKT